MGSDELEEGKTETFESTSDTTTSPIEGALDDAPVTPATPPPPVQDGGTRAWLQVVGSFLVFTNLWGFVFSFGSFQSYYQLHYLPTETPSDISWIGTTATGLLIMCGVASGPLFDKGYFRTMLLVGGLGETLALFLLSLCSQYYSIMLTQGLMTGLMNGRRVRLVISHPLWLTLVGLLYLPGLALVGRSFKKHRSMAMGITTCGAPVGGIIYILMFEQLIDRLGFAWTIRTMAFFMLGTYLISFPLLLWGVSNLGDLASGSPRKLFDPTAFRDLPFWSYSMSNFSLFLGYMVPFIYISVYGQTHLGLSQSTSLNMVIAAQAASVFGRLAAGYAASRIGVMAPFITAGLCSGIFTVAWIGVRSQGSFIAYVVLYGCFSGPLIPLGPSVFPVVCPDPKVLGARLGMAQGIGSIASLIGSPIAGAILGSNKDGNNFLGLQLFSGVVMMLGGCQLIGLYALLVRKRQVGKRI